LAQHLTVLERRARRFIDKLSAPERVRVERAERCGARGEIEAHDLGEESI
jgi:hypothetical protein